MLLCAANLPVCHAPMRHAACLTDTRGVLLRSDGRPVGFGRDHVRQKLPAVGRRFKDLAAGYGHVVFICENGAAVAFGDNDYGQIEIPSGRFIACAAGWHHTLWVRSDGAAVASGRNDNGQCRVPDLPTGLRYTGAAAGWSHSVLLRSDGQAVAFGYDGEGRCTIPTLPLYRRYVSVACGVYHTCLVRDDGIAVAVGKDDHGQASVPDMGQHGYWRAGAGNLHTILLTADGEAVCFGDGSSGECTPPPLPDGLRYVKATGGDAFTVLLRSDGSVVAFGSHADGRTDVPAGRGFLGLAVRKSKYTANGTAGGTFLPVLSLGAPARETAQPLPAAARMARPRTPNRTAPGGWRLQTVVRRMGASAEEETCQICTEELAEGDNVRVLRCWHRYHMECIDEWCDRARALRRAPTCPLCRLSVDTTVLGALGPGWA